MLDPEEISHNIDITEVYAADRSGRQTWWATAITSLTMTPMRLLRAAQ